MSCTWQLDALPSSGHEGVSHADGRPEASVQRTSAKLSTRTIRYQIEDIHKIQGTSRSSLRPWQASPQQHMTAGFTSVRPWGVLFLYRRSVTYLHNIVATSRQHQPGSEHSTACARTPPTHTRQLTGAQLQAHWLCPLKGCFMRGTTANKPAEPLSILGARTPHVLDASLINHKYHNARRTVGDAVCGLHSENES